MELNTFPDYMIDDEILFLELAPVALVFVPTGTSREDREPHSRDIVDCMLAYTKVDMAI